MNVIQTNTYVPPEGLINESSYIIVGEQPGKQEVRAGKPFIGPAGRILNDCLTDAGIARSDCYLTNVIKDLDRPLDSYIKFGLRHPSTSPKGDIYLSEVREEVNCCSAPIVLAVGNVALYAMTGKTGITKWRGSIITDSLVNKIVIPTLHPATVIPPKNVYLNRHLIVYDMLRMKRVAEKGFRPHEKKLLLEPTYQDVISFLHKTYKKAREFNLTIDYDIEIYNEEVSCISFATSSKFAICIPFIDHRGDYFDPYQEATIWKLIARILEDPVIRKRGQNLCFDAHFLLRRLGIKACNFDDTMIAQKIISPDYPVGLDFITSIWTDQSYYKDEGKKWFKVGGSFNTLWHYNACDSIVCAEAFPKQMKELENQGNVETYNRQRRMVEPLVYMMERGIRADIKGIKEASESMDATVHHLQEELNILVGHELNPNSPKQLTQYFYVDKKFRPYKKRGKGTITTDNDAMKRLVRLGSKEAKIIQEIRKLKKLNSTYLDLTKFDKDGRIRCSYNPVGTRYSRISSSANIFGTGMNMQNWPHEILKYLLADEGYIYYSFDLSQAENRIVAYVGNVSRMIQAFETGVDVHSLTASLIFDKDIEEVSDDEGSCPLGDGTHSERFWGKKANHGLNYDLGFKTFAFYYEIPEAQAKFIVNKYHQAYAGIRQTYHTNVRASLARDRTIINLMGRRTLFYGQWGDSMFKEAYSCIPQGTTGDIINERGVEFIYYDQKHFRPIELLNQVHDSLGFQVPISVPFEEHARMLLDIKKKLETPLVTLSGRDFVIPADLTMGFNLSKANSLEIKGSKFPTDIKTLALKLKNNYNKLLGG